MPNFLLVSLRSGELADQIAAAELRDFLRATGLDPADLTHVNLAEVGQTAGDLAGYDGVLVGGSSLNITNHQWDEWQLHVHAEMARISDGIVVGSALVERLAPLSNQELRDPAALQPAVALMSAMRESIDNIK